MTALLALVALAEAPLIVEAPVANSPVIVVQAYVPAPGPLDGEQTAAWFALAEALSDGTEEFSRDRFLGYAGQTGIAFEARATPEFITVRLAVPSGGLDLAGHLTESVLRRAALRERAVAEAIERLRRRRLDPWNQALVAYDLDFRRVNRERVWTLYQQAFFSSKVVVAVAGGFAGGDATVEFAGRLAFDGRPPTFRPGYANAPRRSAATGGDAGVVELTAARVSAEQPDRLLAVFALGVGKTGALHRVLRNDRGWSYRQEAVLWPTVGGWLPRFLVAKRGLPEEPGEIVKEALVADIGTWDHSTLDRALGVARASLAGRFALSPIWLDAGGPDQGAVADAAAWAGFWAMASRPGLSRADVSARLQEVSLEELKVAALAVVEESVARNVPGQAR